MPHDALVRWINGGSTPSPCSSALVQRGSGAAGQRGSGAAGQRGSLVAGGTPTPTMRLAQVPKT